MIKIFKIGLLVTLFLGVSVCYAQVNSEKVFSTEQGEINAWDSELEGLFYSSIKLYEQGQPGQAAEKLKQLSDNALKRGYFNLPGYSQILMEQAKQAEAVKDYQKSIFWLRQALFLSPQDARTNLGMLAFTELMGWHEASEYIGKGLGYALYDPYLIVSLARNVLLLLLVGLTLSFFFTAIIQISANREALLNYLARNVSVRARGLLSGILLFLILSIPLFFGLLVALCCWSLFLALCVRSTRRLGYYSGMLVLLWAIFIPLLERVTINLNSKEFQVIEDYSKQSYRTGNKAILQKTRQANPSDPLLLLIDAENSLFDGELEKADNLYNKYIKETSVKSLNNVAYVNLGLTSYLRGMYDRSLQMMVLAEISEKSASYFYLYSQLMLARVDTKLQTEYHQKALERDRKWLVANESLLQDNILLTAKMIPMANRFQRIVGYGDSSSAILSPKKVATQRLIDALFPIRSVKAMLVFGLVVIAVGWRFAKLALDRREIASVGGNFPSAIWLLMPCGYFMRGRFPLVGIFLFGAFVSYLMFAYEEPIKVVDILPVKYQIAGLTIFAVSFIVLMIGVVSYFLDVARKRNKGEA